MHIPDHSAHRGTSVILSVILAAWIVMPSPASSTEKISPSLLSGIVTQQAGRLAAIDSDASAIALFTTTVGPSLGLRDAAGTLGAKGLPPKLAKELGLAELSLSVQQLMAALVAWQLADMVSRAEDGAFSPTTPLSLLPPTERQEWIKAGSHLSTLTDFFRVLTEQRPSDPAEPAPRAQRTELLLAAHRLTFEAYQHATAAWWDLYEWKERVRRARGQARLCGTWQWHIHNHQNHREEKTVMLFPPAGQAPVNVPLPAETVVLGDNVYLRWEQDGHIQEDSLLFINEGTRIEGSFVNNTGGWGSITGKRTAGCRP